MGRGTITESLGRGEYTISLDYGATELQSKIDRLTARINEYDSTIIPGLEDAVTAAEAATSGAVAAVNAAISAWAAVDYDQDSPERQAIDDVVKEWLPKKYAYQAAITAKASAELERDILNKEKADLSAYTLSSTASVWCADYTIDGEGIVATAEVPGEPATTLIVPGCVPPVADDGYVTGRVIQKSYQSYWNISALPAWQKWKPTYRFATIDTIDRANNTCSLTLEAATSTATGEGDTGLDINQTTTLLGVEFEYLRCNHAAFSVGDDVLVKFENQAWDQPKVIGFKSNPKPCAGGILRYIGTPEAAIPTPGIWVTKHEAESESNLLVALRASTQSSPIVPYGGLVYCEFRVSGENDWILCPLSNITYYNESLNVFKQGSLFQGVPGYEPVRWHFDVVYPGPVNPVFDLFDASGEIYHVIDSPQPTNVSVEDLYYFAYLRNMVYAASDQHTNAAVVGMLRPSGTGIEEWPEKPVTGVPSTLEFRIRTPSNSSLGIQEQIHLHCYMDVDTQEVFNYFDIDMLTEAVPNDVGYTGPPYWLDPPYTPTVLEDYSILPDGTVYYYTGSGTDKVDAEV